MTKRMPFVLIAVLLAVAGLLVRAHNTQTANTKVKAIIAQDASGTDAAAAIADLRTFASAHMGGGETFTLTGSLTRAQAASAAAANAAANASAQVYSDAQKACGGKSDSITQAKCNQQYLAVHLPAAPQPAPVPTPNPSDYRYVVHAPRWTPDLSGALFVGAAVALFIGVLNLFGGKR